MRKKIKFYFLICFILWTGAFVQKMERDIDVFINANHTIKEQTNRINRKSNSLQKQNNNSKENVIFLKKEYKGKKSQTEMKEEISFLLASYKGEFVTEVFGENFYSVYGFSDSISNYIFSDGKKINLNFVITYNEEKDITSIIGASPFYNEDF